MPINCQEILTVYVETNSINSCFTVFITAASNNQHINTDHLLNANMAPWLIQNQNKTQLLTLKGLII